MEIDKLAGLLNRAKQNDDAAINELYGQIHSLIWFWARKVVKSDDDADEVTQRTLITTFRKLDMIQNPDAFLGWLKTTTMRQAKDYMLEAHNRYDISFHDAGDRDDEGNESDYDPAAEGLEYNPAEALDDKVKKEVLGGILDALPSDQRLVVNMFWFDNMTSRAIAEELGCSENTIKSRLKYAKAKIKDKVEEYQKKTGEKLYTVSPIAVLLWLYKDAEKAQIMEIPWGAEAYPALEQTYHARISSAQNAPSHGGNDSGASGNGGDSGASGSNGAGDGASNASAQSASASNSASASASNAVAHSANVSAGATNAAQSAAAAGVAVAGAHAAGAGILAGGVGKALIAAAIVAGAGGAAVGISHATNRAPSAGANVQESAPASANGSASGAGAESALPEDGKILNEAYLADISAPAQTIDADDFGDMVSHKQENDGSSLYPLYEMTGFGSNWGYTNANSNDKQYATDYPTPVIRVQKGGLWGVMDYSGNLLNDYKASVIYYDVAPQSYVEYIDNVAYELNGDYSQGMVLPDGFGGAGADVYVRDGRALTYWLSGEEPYYSTNGNRFIAPVIDGAYAPNSTASGYAIVGADGSVTALPSDGVPLSVGVSTDFYDSMQQTVENGNEVWMAGYSTFANGVIKMLNSAGKIALYDADAQSYITGYDYDDATYYNDGVCGVKQGDKWAFIDRSGKLLSDFVYDKVSAVSGGKVVVKDALGIRIIDITNALENAGYTVAEEETVSAPAETTTSAEEKTIIVLVDRLNIRTEPSTSAESVGHAENGATYTFSNVVFNEGYTWYQISDGNWIADQNGELLAVSGN